MIANDFMRVTCYFEVNSIPDAAVMVWDYRCAATDNPITLTLDGSYIASSFIDRYYAPFAAYLSNRVHMTQISIRSWQYPSDGYDAVGALWQGESNALMLPPANTVAFRLVRSNYSMRNGRKAFPGGTVEQLSAGGIFNPSVASALAAITDVWADTSWNVEFPGGEAEFGEYVVRVPTTPDTNPTVFYPINAYGTAYWGTQNSRKA